MRKELALGQLILLTLVQIMMLHRPVHADPFQMQKLSSSVNGRDASVTFSSVPAGHLIILLCQTDTSETLSSSTPSSMQTAVNQAGNSSHAIFYKVAAGGETTATCTSGSNARLAIHGFVYSGIQTSSPLDGTPGTNGGNSGTALSTNSTTTSVANTLLIAGAVSRANGNISAWSNSFNEEFDFQIAGTTINASATRIVSSTGTYTTTATATASDDWRAQIAAFKAITPVLSTDIVDASNASVASPSVSLSSVNEGFSCQTPTGTLGSSSQKLRVTNYTATATWTLSIAATSGATSTWASGGNTYDFNDSGGCTDGGDTDTVGGQLTINANAGTVAASTGCSATTGITKGSSTAFVEGTTNSITLLNASSSADVNCTWDLTGATLSQSIPAEQADGSYSINLTLTIVAS